MPCSLTKHYRPPFPIPPKRRLGPLKLLSALARNPLECWSEEFFREPIVRVRLPFFEAVIVNDVTAIKRVLIENAENYRKDPLQRRILSNGLADGLLSVEGPRWEMQRRTLAPLFAKRTVSSFTRRMLDVGNGLATEWAGLGNEAVVDVAAAMTRLTLNVLAVTIFSDGIGQDYDQFRLAMNAYFAAIGRIGILDLLGAPAWLPRMGQRRLQKTMAYFENVIDELIRTRARKLSECRTIGGDDLLSLLLNALDPSTGRSMVSEEVRSNILTFLSAGHETTANALAWSVFLLAQEPAWRALVQAEAERELQGPLEALADRLTMTRAVVEEALRLYPPIAAISRMARADDVLAGEQVSAGSLIVIAPYVLHRHQRLWQAPADFDPSRFLGERRAGIDRFAFLPFGIGPRVCIGASFALQEATIVLALLASKFEMEVVSASDIWPVQRVTLRPSELRMKIRARR